MGFGVPLEIPIFEDALEQAFLVFLESPLPVWEMSPFIG